MLRAEEASQKEIKNSDKKNMGEHEEWQTFNVKQTSIMINDSVDMFPP